MNSYKYREIEKMNKFNNNNDSEICIKIFNNFQLLTFDRFIKRHQISYCFIIAYVCIF